MRRLLGATAMTAVPTTAITAGILAGGGGGAEASRFTSHLDALESALTARSADPGLPKNLAKLYGKGLRTLGGDTSSLLADVAAAAKVVPRLEKKAASKTTVIAAATSAVDGLVGAVTAGLAQAEADADLLLGAKKDPLTKLPRLLVSASGRLQRATSAPTISGRIRLLVPAAKGVSQAQAVIAKAKDPGPDPDPALCGPTTAYDEWIRQQLRAVAGDESFLADVTDFDRMYAFEGGSILALAGPSMGLPGAAEVLDLRAYDCARKSAIQFSIPFPPAAGTTYTEANGGAGGYQYDYDGMIEVYPRGNRVTVDTVDVANEVVTGTFAFGGVANGRFTVRGWRAPAPFVPPFPPPPAKPRR